MAKCRPRRHARALLAGLMWGLALWSATAEAAGAIADFRNTDRMSQPIVLPDLSRSEFTLAHHGRKLVLVHFFATWCEPCREEIPALNRLIKRSAKSETPIALYEISVRDADLAVRRFAQDLQLANPILLDRDGAVAKSWTVTSLPTTYVLDSDLVPRLLVEQDVAWDDIDLRQLSDLMNTDGATVQAVSVQHN